MRFVIESNHFAALAFIPRSLALSLSLARYSFSGKQGAVDTTATRHQLASPTRPTRCRLQAQLLLHLLLPALILPTALPLLPHSNLDLDLDLDLEDPDRFEATWATVPIATCAGTARTTRPPTTRI